MHNVTKYDGMLAAKHCEELTETATKTANNCTLSYSEPENHFFVSFWRMQHQFCRKHIVTIYFYRLKPILQCLKLRRITGQRNTAPPEQAQAAYQLLLDRKHVSGLIITGDPAQRAEKYAIGLNR